MTPSKTQPALLGGLAIGVLSALPVVNLANCCCAWILFGGALAAYLAQQNQPEPIRLGDGAAVGFMAGVVGAVASAVISIPIRAAMAPFQSRLVSRLIENASDMPPAAREFLQGLSGAPVIGIGMVLGFIVMLCISSIFATLGGLFGALLFRKNPTSVPPPLPPGVS